jgi:hypothetical protein
MLDEWNDRPGRRRRKKKERRETGAQKPGFQDWSAPTGAFQEARRLYLSTRRGPRPHLAENPSESQLSETPCVSHLAPISFWNRSEG